MKITTYNVNGIRSAASKGLRGYIEESGADIVCFQELKALPEQIDAAEFESLGYSCYWYSAQKKGYSGVGIISKEEPNAVVYGCGHELFDAEGRVIRADYDWGSVLSVYFPSGSSGDSRQDVKMVFLEYFFDYVEDLRKAKPNLVVCGDYNVCHRAIDIHDPVSNKNSSGFLPEERAWMDRWFESGFVDSFRELHAEPHHYTWWSFRANARANNKGWRIDYISVSRGMAEKIGESGIDAEAKHSDHCPSWVVLE
jgi:exodeoxyribonuclease III